MKERGKILCVFSRVFKPRTIQFEEELLIFSYTVNSILRRKPVKGLYLRRNV